MIQLGCLYSAHIRPLSLSVLTANHAAFETPGHPGDRPKKTTLRPPSTEESILPILTVPFRGLDSLAEAQRWRGVIGDSAHVFKCGLMTRRVNQY